MNVIIDYRTSEKAVSSLSRLGFNPVKTPRLAALYEAVCGHADIMVHKLAGDRVITEPGVQGYFSAKLDGCTVAQGSSILSSKYPFDIAYNCARVGKNIICNEKYTDENILKYYRERDFKIINTKQGYAKCSICTVSDNAIITSDKNIARQAGKNGIDVLFTDDGNIRLGGFEHGFIGGATGLLSKKLLAVNGDLNFHSDCGKIYDFCALCGVDIVSLSDEEIVDIGSIIAV